MNITDELNSHAETQEQRMPERLWPAPRASIAFTGA